MRPIAILMATILAASASGCATGAKSDSTKSDSAKSDGAKSDGAKSNGAKTFTYDCSGLGKGWGDCTEKADAQCGTRKYEIISQTGSAEEKGTGGNTEMKRTLVVSCK